MRLSLRFGFRFYVVDKLLFGMHAELRVNRLHVRASGVFADEELLCDCCARVAVYKQHHDFRFSFGKTEGFGDLAACGIEGVCGRFRGVCLGLDYL